MTVTKQLQITLVKSVIGQTVSQRETVKSLGLRKLQQTVLREDTPAVRGMVNKVSHLVAYSEIDG